MSDVGLYGVSCVSADACMAVGYGERGNGYYAFVLSWNGTRWSMAPFSQPGSSSVLDGVSCLPGGACTAVGFYQKNTGSNAGPHRVLEGPVVCGAQPQPRGGRQ